MNYFHLYTQTYNARFETKWADNFAIGFFRSLWRNHE